MMFDRRGFDRVLADSGLTKGEIAFLCGVSRQTLYNWIKGGVPTQHLIARYTSAVIRGIVAAIDAGVLPLPASLDHQKRKQRLQRMQQTLHQLAKPQPEPVK